MGSTVNGIYIPLVGETNWGDEVSANQRRLADLNANVKALGAVGDGVADDTAEIQAAFDAAAASGNGRVFLPGGDYKITSTLTLDQSFPIRISGVRPLNADVGSQGSRPGTRIFGSLSGALLQRTTSATTAPYIIEDVSFENTHATGTCVSLVGIESPGGIYRCYFRSHNGVILGANVFQCAIEHCRFSRAGATYASSTGLEMGGHGYLVNNDFAAYEVGILAHGPASVINGGRIETCGTGVYLGTGGDLFKGTVSNVNFEACDTAAYVREAGPAVLSGLQILGTAGSPSGGSLYGVNIDSTIGVTLLNCGAGGNATADFNIPSAAIRQNLSLIGCSGTNWTISDDQELRLINCGGAPTTITPSQITSNQDNYFPTGMHGATTVRLSTDASRDITGINRGSGTAERQKTLINVGSFNVVLKHDVTSTAINRFLCPGSVDYTLTPNSTAIITYDSTSTRWRVK